jgi:S1-C subfamily serine protease
VTAVDIGIIIGALALAAVGWERGLIAAAMPLAGFVGGVALGARLAPTLLEGGAESPYAPAVAAAGGVLLGLFLAIALEGLGSGLSQRLDSVPVGRVADRCGGALLFLALALAIAWVFGAVALHVPGQDNRSLRQAVQRSTILAALNEQFPPSGPLLNVLRRINPTPTVRGPDADVAPPTRAALEDPDVQAAGASVVRVRGTACGLGIEGSGWVAGPEIVVTNAHVVAGQDDTTVATADGAEYDVEVLAYQPRNDVAILRAPGLDAPPLSLAKNPKRGTVGAVIGYPGGGSLTLRPARLGQTGRVTSQDSYGRGPVQRLMTPFRGDVRGGNSGGPVVNRAGRVLATVFAASTDREHTGLGVPNGVIQRILDSPLAPGEDTGPCAV